MSNKAQQSIMPNKEPNKTLVTEVKVAPVVQNATPSKVGAAATTAKANVTKTTSKDSAMSPVAAPASHANSELLGSLTTLQQQRTSARVIKKLRTEAPDPDKRDIPECDTPSKIDEKDPLKFPTVKQRMPKALWSADEKSLFFEALNEYGKDFDAITTHICAKMKKKGMPDVNLKTKTQVSHFYYRTWHKLSKHMHFGENVKKVAQELYALINYGELRKKLVSVSEKTCARLHEMVLSGSMVVRHRGRNVRVRTPMCRALRRLNQMTERSCALGACAMASVSLRARTAGAWARVQAAAHNPRAQLALSPRTPLAALLRALDKRWQGKLRHCKPKLESLEMEPEEPEPPRPEEAEDELEDHLNLETDRIIVQEQRLAKRPVLHVGPRPTTTVRLPVVRASEQLSSQKICFSSYLQRMYSQGDKEAGAKIRTPKRHRKDSNEKDKELLTEQKRPRMENEPKLDIDETAVDGIELMANYKINQEDEEKPSTEDEKEIKAEETAEEEGENKYMSEREKDSFSEMEDDEKYIKSDSDNESDKDKGEKKTKFKNLKVKFRIRPKKRGGSIYTLVTEKEGDEPKAEEPKEDEPSDIDVDSAVKQIRKGWSVYDAGDLTIGDLYLMFGARSKLDLDYWWAEPTPPLPKKELEKTPPQEKRPERTPDKGTDSSLEDEKERRESDSDIFSPKASGQDSNDGMSGDERKPELLVSSPERKPCLSSLNLASKLVNRPAPAAPTPDGFSQLSERLKRLLAMAGNPHVGGGLARCNCGHVCSQQRKQQPKPGSLPPQRAEPSSPVFRHPTPIAPKPTSEAPLSMSLADVPRWRRGRPRGTDRRVVVQRLLPLLPKLPPPSNLIPVKIVPSSPPAPPRILPRPPPTATSDLSFFYVLSESNGQFFFHDGDRRIPISPQDDQEEESVPSERSEIFSPRSGHEETQDEDTKEFKIDISPTEVAKPLNKPPPDGELKAEPSGDSSAEPSAETNESNTATSEAGEKEKKPENAAKPLNKPPPDGELKAEPSGDSSAEPGAETNESNTATSEAGEKEKKPENADFLAAESMSLSPSRLLADGWLAGAHDFSLSSFLGQLEPAPELAVDSQLQSLMAESSVDYVAKFADLAAEVTDERPPPPLT